ncbi:hypothetical protein CEXT_309831 [Caerostris extrusa]|uniref:Uncharacterized protein n=1 Tax=Caerostris extrusa TaxID=172846 RepID=A0AAV4UGK8_CAEEX|nr:hypothetical protein CEXT_309831 [Caerostris extrusa]
MRRNRVLCSRSTTISPHQSQFTNTLLNRTYCFMSNHNSGLEETSLVKYWKLSGVLGSAVEVVMGHIFTAQLLCLQESGIFFVPLSNTMWT